MSGVVWCGRGILWPVGRGVTAGDPQRIGDEAKVLSKNRHLNRERLSKYVDCRWVGLSFPLNGNRTNVQKHVVVVYEHVWRTVCSVCATGARVAQPVACNS